MSGWQQIRLFHDRVTPPLEEILERYRAKQTPKTYQTVISPCRRLIQKCSCKSVLDTSRLSALAYWLYIYGDKALALRLCEAAHGVELPFEFSGWNGGIHTLFGLEVRIARELLGEDRRKEIPPQLLEHCFSKRVKKEVRYPKILREDRIAGRSGSFLDTELLLALYDMIGFGETGLYTELNENWQAIEEAIGLYIGCLKAD